MLSAFAAWTLDDFLKVIALVGGVITFAIGLAQYRRTQQWKRAEWVAQEMKQLFADPIVQAALLMIDWESRSILLYPDRVAQEGRYVFVTNEIVAGALVSHKSREGDSGFTMLEADIRSAFDRLLDGLERFNSYVVTGLVEIADLEPYLMYWARKVMRDWSPDPMKQRIERLRSYMDAYGFDGAHALLKQIAAVKQGRKGELPARTG